MPVQTLNELSQLRKSNFGRPKPRHGLQLLFWFAHDFVRSQSNQMAATSHPRWGEFGFHQFYNRIDDDDTSPLLPHQNVNYYEVGNLNEGTASHLPKYVREQYTGRQDHSNTDRIIIAIDSDWCIHRVYVTQHSDPMNFSRDHTYRISQGLVNIISRLNLTEFLSEMGKRELRYALQSDSRSDVHYTSPIHRPTESSNECKSLCLFVFIVAIVAVMVIFFPSLRKAI